MKRRFLIALAAAALTFSCGRPSIELPSPDLLAQQVTIRRDTYGIPHILAETEEAAAFAFGYAQAEDHAAEIGRRYLSARGEEAAHFGEEGLSNDVAMAHFDNLAASRAALERITPLYRRIISAYAAGVNRYVRAHRSELPPWMPEITAADVLAHTRAGAASSLGGAALVRRLREKYEGVSRTGSPGVRESGGTGESASSSLDVSDDGSPEPRLTGAPDPRMPGSPDPRPPGPPDPRMSGSPDPRPPGPPEEEPYWIDEAPGSNAFALAGSRTTTGKPILLGNPHLQWSSLYWEAHVRVPGTIDFYGSTLVGIPVLRAGFNDRLGFVTTNNAPDLDDVFALKLDPERQDHYLFDGRSMPLQRRDATIQVRAADGSMRAESRTFWSSHVGPVVYRTADRVFSVKSSRLEAFQYFEGFYGLSKTRNLKDWMSELRRNYVPTSNFTYADVDGNIQYFWNARVPVRKDGLDYRLDVDANTPADLWNGFHAIDDFPRLLNPPGGYVQNANNPPQFVSLRDPIDMSRYPSQFERGSLALRPQLALDLLESKDTFSVAEVIDLKYSTRMLLAERVKRDVIDAVRATVEAPEEAQAGADVLEAWDDKVAADSRGAVLFQRFWDQYSSAVRPAFATPWQESNPAKTPSGIADRAAAVTHLAAAVGWTRGQYGSERVAWGDVNRFRAGTLDLPGDGATGTYGTFRVMTFAALPSEAGERSRARVAGHIPGRETPIGFGDGWVLLVDFSRPGQAWSVLAYGQTTSQASPHSSDQLPIFAGHKLRRAWYTEADIRANLRREYRP